MTLFQTRPRHSEKPKVSLAGDEISAARKGEFEDVRIDVPGRDRRD